MTASGKNRIMIFGPRSDGIYVVEFKTAKVGQCPRATAISAATDQRARAGHVQERMPWRLLVPVGGDQARAASIARYSYILSTVAHC
jgi:hypothetical protein